MKKSLISVIMLSSSLAVAGPVTVVKNWTGFYVGAEAGVIFNHFDVTSEQLGFSTESGTCNGSKNHSSFFPGIFLGLQQQFQNKVVLGIESDFTYNLTQTSYFECPCDANVDVFDGFTFKNQVQGTLRGRLGFAVEAAGQQFLPFLMGGVSAADLGLTYQNEAGDFYSENKARAGWLAGGGLEWKLNPRWSVRALYSFVDYEHSINLPIPVVYGLTDPNGQANLELSAQSVAVGVSYWV